LQKLAILPNAQLAFGSYSGTIVAWNMSSQTQSAGFYTYQTNYGLVMNPISGYMVYGGLQSPPWSSLSLRNVATFRNVLWIPNNNSYLGMEILLPSGNLVLAGMLLDIYDGFNGSHLFTFNNTENMNSIKLLPDNVTVACGLVSGALILFNSNTYAFANSSIIAHTQQVNVLVVTPDSLFLISGSQDQTIIMWLWSTMSLTKVNTFSVAGQVISGAVLASSFTGLNCCLFY
jgi:WD40 repeat protein